MFDFKEDDVLYGDSIVTNKMDKAKALACFGYIKSDIDDLKTSFIRLGFHLNEYLSTCGNYFCFGYNDGFDAVEKNFGLSRSSVSRLIDVWKRFSLVNYSSHTMFIDPRYSDYNYSQLCEMLPLKDADLKRFNSRMTVREMRELKKEIKNQYKSNNSGALNNNVIHPDSSLAAKASCEHKICDVAKNNDVYDVDSYVLRSSVVAEIERLKKDMLAGDEDGQYFSGYVDALNLIKKFVN